MIRYHHCQRTCSLHYYLQSDDRHHRKPEQVDNSLNNYITNKNETLYVSHEILLRQIIFIANRQAQRHTHTLRDHQCSQRKHTNTYFRVNDHEVASKVCIFIKLVTGGPSL